MKEVFILFICILSEKNTVFVNYNLELNLDTTNRILKGKETVEFKNIYEKPVKELYFNLYINAYSNFNTYAFKKFIKKRTILSFLKIFSPLFYDFPYIRIDSIKQNNKKINCFIEETILKVPLEKEIKKGESVKVEIFFETKLSSIVRFRHGRVNNHYDFGLFYPALCKYDEKGWHVIKRDFHSEIYHNFANYLVKIRVPGNYIVAGSGECISKNDIEKKKDYKEVTFKAQRVVDFAFSCSPEFLSRDTIIDKVHISVFFKDSTEGIKLFKFTIESFKWLKKIFGEYPYKWLKVVHGIIQAGGMEFPGFAICSQITPEVIIHEISHTYFFACIATNQIEEAWLDEGGATFLTRWYKIKKEKKKKKYILNNTKNITHNIREGFDDILLTPSYDFKNDYFIVYSKGSHIYDMLLDIMGEKKFIEFLKGYYKKYKFKHPTTEDFFREGERISKRNLEFIKESYVKKLPVADFSIDNLKIKKNKNNWNIKIYLSNKGNTIYPLELLFISYNDTFKTRTTFFKRDTILEYTLEFKPKKVIIDPLNYSLDVKRIDNFYPRIFEKKLSFYHFKNDKALTLNYFPSIFYTPHSGLCPGFLMNFSYIENYPFLKVESYYSFKRRKIYFDFLFKFRFPYTGGKNILYFKSLNFEERYLFTVYYKKEFREYKNEPSPFDFHIGIIHKRVEPEGVNIFFDNVNITGIWGNLSMFPRTDILGSNVILYFSHYPEKLSGDFSFNKFISQIEIFPSFMGLHSPLVMELINIKISYGKMDGKFPLFEYFSNYGYSSFEILSSYFGRNFLLSESEFFITNKGIPLKGYRFVKFKSFFSIMLSMGIKNKGIFYEKVWGDTGKFYDFGIFLNFFILKKKIKFTLYLPFYINKPEINNEKNKWGFRLKFSISKSE